ncbi:MAG: response regulator [bacterium]
MPRNILVIDDEESIRKYFKRLLEGMGYTVELAETGDAGRELAVNPAVELIITDLQMPGNPSGMDLVKALRALRPECPVVVISGHPTDDRLKLAGELGVEFLTKPFELSFIRQILERIFDKA